MSKAVIEVVVAWLPLVLIVGAWMWLMRRQLRGPGGMTQGEYMHQIVEETRRQNDALLKLLTTMDERIKRLEDRR
jgi:ATP-dependent Zn protease